MAIYAIGDVQGCLRELQALLDRLVFDPRRDRLWLTGDLVNRGPQSLEVLRFVKGLGEAVVTVLGNHDLHLLALAEGGPTKGSTSGLEQVLKAPDRDEILQWLRTRSLLHHDPDLGFTLVHAGLPPQWDLQTARACARELESRLAHANHGTFLTAMYGDKPDLWDNGLSGTDRLRFITNCLTRLRYCDKEGRLALREKGPPGTQPPSLYPWFLAPGRRSAGDRILFGHWSSLGFGRFGNTWALDSGCLWGGALTALRIDLPNPRALHQPCAGAHLPSGRRQTQAMSRTSAVGALGPRGE
jgi:bis(5'-nucleosyl)-tetraphosphatase (symmetrical)